MAIVPRKNKNGSTSFQVKVKDHTGKWFKCPAFATRALAEDEELRLKKLKRKGAKAISDDAKTVTVDDYWCVWEVENRSGVSEGWKISQNQMYRDYIKPVIGDEYMIKVGPPEIGKVLNRAQTLGLGDQTRKHIYSLVRRMFGDAIDYYEMLTVNPVKPKFHRPRVADRKRKFLIPAQTFMLMDYSKTHYLGPAIWLACLAALRISEIQALVGECIMHEHNQILIRAAYNKKTRQLQEHPKQENWAYVPMVPMLKKYLASLKTRPHEFVSQSETGGMLPYETFSRALKRICKAAGVPEVSPHELRHSCTEIWVQAGASAEDIRRLLNQSSLTATKGYIHRTDDRLNSLGKLIARPTAVKARANENFPNSFPNGKKRAKCLPVKGVTRVH